MRLPPKSHPYAQWGDCFEIETLINVRIVANGLKVAGVCSFEASRIYGDSNFNAVRDGMRVLRTIRREFEATRRQGGQVRRRPTRLRVAGSPRVPAMAESAEKAS